MSAQHRPRTTAGRPATHFLLALVVALVGLMTTAAPASATGATTPVVVGSPSDVPAGAVEDVPSQYQTAGECDTTRSWTLVVPPTTTQQYRHPLERRSYTPGTAETSHQEYKYKKTVPAVDGVKEYLYKKPVATYKTQHWAKYQKHVKGRVEKWTGSWTDTGANFDWTKWEGSFWNTSGSFQVRDWSDTASPDVIGQGGHSSVSDQFVQNGHTYRLKSEYYSYRVIDRETREVQTGTTYEYSGWTTDLLGSPWIKVDERWKTEPQPAYDVYYNDGSWTRDVLGSPWVKYDERKVVDSPAVPASFSPWTFDAWTAWSDSSTAPADPDGQSGDDNPLNLRRVGTPMEQRTVEVAAGYTQQYVWSDGKLCETPPPSDIEVLPEEASGKAVGFLRVSCQGTVRVTMRNRSDERAVYTVRIAKRKHTVRVGSGKTRRWVGSAAPRQRAQLWLDGDLLASKRLPRACVAPEVLPDTGQRG